MTDLNEESISKLLADIQKEKLSTELFVYCQSAECECVKMYGAMDNYCKFYTMAARKKPTLLRSDANESSPIGD